MTQNANATGEPEQGADDLKAAVKQWQDGILRTSLENEPSRAAEITTGSGETVVKEVYTPLDAPQDYLAEVGLPGQYPYARGIYPLGHRGKEWSQEFYAGYGSAKNANERYKALVGAGANGFSLALDLPTQIGYDSDDPAAEGEVGKVGLALDTVNDLVAVMEGIPMDKVALTTVGNSIGPWIVAMWSVLGERIGMKPTQMATWAYQPAWLQNDPFKEYAGRGTYIFPVNVAIDMASDVVQYAFRNLPGHHCQYVCTTQMRWGGSSAGQEIGFGIANMMAYVDAAEQKGVPREEHIPTMNLHMTTDNDLFEEVAKFRAARRLRARLAKERFDTSDPRVLKLRLTTWTGSHRLTAQQPMNNIIRTSVHVLASMLGGLEQIHTPAHDEALALPTFESTYLAHLTKHILHDECGVDSTVDPLGGSYYVESLTDRLEEEGRYWYEKTQSLGGAVEAAQQGFYLKQMADGMYRNIREVEEGTRKVVGLNTMVTDKAAPIHLFKNDPTAEARQIENLHQVKAARDAARVEQCLGEIRRVAEKKVDGQGENIVPSIVDAVRVDATVGEIFSALREVFGEYKPKTMV